VVTDRFYTSVGLALALMRRGLHLVGTILTDKRGVSPSVVWESGAKLPRWTAMFRRHWKFPRLLLQSWQDRGQVHMYVAAADAWLRGPWFVPPCVDPGLCRLVSVS
jgi:hypothetical protein